VHEVYGGLVTLTYQIKQSQSAYFILHFHFKAQTTVHEHHKNKHLVHKSAFGGGRRSHKTFKISRPPYALLAIVFT